MEEGQYDRGELFVWRDVWLGGLSVWRKAGVELEGDVIWLWIVIEEGGAGCSRMLWITMQAERDEAESALRRLQLSQVATSDPRAEATPPQTEPIPSPGCSPFEREGEAPLTLTSLGGATEQGSALSAARASLERELLAKTALIERLKAQVGSPLICSACLLPYPIHCTEFSPPPSLYCHVSHLIPLSLHCPVISPPSTGPCAISLFP